MRRNIIFACVVLMIGLIFSLHVFVRSGFSYSIRDDGYSGSLSPAFVEGELLVKFEVGTSEDDVRNLAAENGLNVIEDLPRLGIKRMSTPAGTEEAMSKRLSQNPKVVYAEPNGIVRGAEIIPNDPYYTSHQWNMNKINAPQAWDINTGSNDIVIAVLDTGVDYTNLDLNDPQKLLDGYNIVNPLDSQDNPAQDDNGHGTHVAGIATASTDNSMGVAGVSWGSKILPIKVLNSVNEGTTAILASGIAKAIEQNADVINMSLGSSINSPIVQEQINLAYENNIVMIAAAGNSGTNAYSFPASNDHVISVAATDSNDAHAYFSQFNDRVAVAAPGITTQYPNNPPANVGIFSTWWPNQLVRKWGTSMSAPHVSGLAALLLSQNPSLTPDQVKYQLEANAEQKGSPGFNYQYGFGRINAYYALKEDINYLMPWYDEQTAGMQDWVMMANPSTNAATLNTSLTVGADLPPSLKGTYAMGPGANNTPHFAGLSGGPVKVSSSDGSTKALFSQRAFYNNNFNETMGIPESKLDTDYYFTWYDFNYPGSNPRTYTWINVSNRGTATANVEVYVHNVLKGTYQIAPNGIENITYDGLRDGPVRVRSTNNQKLLVSERTLYNGGFNEVLGTPASSLAAEYSYTWYDMSSFTSDWLMISNLDGGENHVEVYIHDMANPYRAYDIPAYSSITPDYPQTVNGPIKVKCTTCAGGQDSIITSQRTIYQGHFEELPGAPASALDASLWFTWYDTQYMSSYIMMSNTNASGLSSTVDIYIANLPNQPQKMNASPITIAPGSTQYAFYGGMLRGPVEVRKTSGPNVLVSQRVTYGSSFNEILGASLSS